MAADRFVRFGEEHPTRGEVEFLLRDLLGDAALGVEWDRDRFYVSLHGELSFPFARLAPEAPNPHADDEGRGRWIEVWLGDDGGTIDVMTRGMDEYTHAVADRVTDVLARWWGGEVEDERPETRLRLAARRAVDLIDRSLGDSDPIDGEFDEHEEPLVAALQTLVAALGGGSR